ncbi:ABC transporter ATP-binding protein [Chitinasiproducens palmae]|nr:oligopeptide/dipeptide ABC transporter ATP-binding protein [Chitinasiproducens palmae]
MVRNLAKYFPLKRTSWLDAALGRAPDAVRAVDALSFEILKGETLGVVGESGCGKSTTSRLMMALQRPTAGEIIFDGELVGSRALPLKAYRRQVQMVFQDSYASLNPRASIEDSIAFPLRVHGIDRRTATARAHDLLDAVGLHPAQFARRFPHQLSGGQRQRINIARALALKPRLVILDEPVSALDKSVEAQVLNLLVDLKSQFGLTYMFISHDLNVVQYIADRILVMYLGKPAEIGDARDVFDDPAHPYTAALLASRPTARRRRSQSGDAHVAAMAHTQVPTGTAPLRGDPPNPINPPSGCVFRTRCAHAEDVCAVTVPPLTPVTAVDVARLGAPSAASAAPGRASLRTDMPAHLAACLRQLPQSGHSAAPPPKPAAAVAPTTVHAVDEVTQ